MRKLPFFLALLPLPALADDIALNGTVSAVTLYPQGATITREMPFSMPAGQHRLILTDLPRDTPLERVRVSVTGARMGGVTTRADFVPPRDITDPPALAQARARVEAAENALRAARAEVETIRLEQTAAQAQVNFLGSLSGTGADLSADAVRSLATTVAQETLSALRAAHDAAQRAGATERALIPLEEDLENAKQAMAALVPDEGPRAMLSVAVSAETPAQGMLSVTYTIPEAGWTPVYDLHLTRATGALTITRGAFIEQHTGENWNGVTLTLSTTRPSEQTAPSEIVPLLRRIFDPQPIAPKARLMADDAPMALAESAPMTAQADFDGISVSYGYSAPVNIATGADRLRLILGEISLPAALRAEAAPLWDSSAFLVARARNDTGEPLLPTGHAMFYLDGRFVGQQPLDLIPAGAEAQFAFGPIDGLRLTRTVIRNEGDRGLISRSEEWQETVRLKVENLTGDNWPLRVVDRIPYAEQEDLKITWSASPEPAETDPDGKQGVMAWTFDLQAGATRQIELTHRMSWPEGKILR
ncbi:uncharacterized protein (TIGR02231 family) [Rhodovulum imhoffii]|uniref:Uncharacterized protein (TIGR02231 family) n=1 Tax=Rhodovulum imhoffii TaxID=365340 RepID=A0A2T5BSG5_9RHOB|nr:DUF4139 domain-containing protein [Rhodovulum imhoffii]MBK5933485.1 hypothetical protein [Rhodovulum imhoffii]PTN02278.1 uncharacterized protein (TIGR02231 family) [Rhodovulum imhoffii]